MAPSSSPSPLLSIIIPTRENQRYAQEVVTSILRTESSDFELVVQDNSNSNSLGENVRAELDDPRLRYSHTETPLSIVDNFEEAIKRSSGAYVCMIGDDDGVNPEIVEAARWAHSNNLDALRYSLAASYVWPDLETPRSRPSGDPEVGVVTILPFSGRLTKTEPETEMKSLVASGGWRYQAGKIPRLYHGLVRRECLENIRRITGSYFGGLVPDIYSAVAVANVARTVISLDYPLTIGGVCRTSGSAAAKRKEHVGSLDRAPQLRHRGAYEWSELVPPFYSVQTVWADSAIAALEAFGRDDLISDLNIPRLASDCLVANPRHAFTILRSLTRSLQAMGNSTAVGYFKLLEDLLIGQALSLSKRASSRVQVRLSANPIRRQAGPKNMVEATEVMTEHLREGGWRLSDYLP